MDILDLILAEANAKGFDPEFVTTVVRKESNFNPSAVSPTGARGLGQITRVALRHFNEANQTTYDRADLFDPSINIMISVWYLRWIATALKIEPKEFASLTRSSRVRIYAAYNVGIGTLNKLESGRIDSSARRLIGMQARALSSGGAENYLTRVEQFIA